MLYQLLRLQGAQHLGGTTSVSQKIGRVGLLWALGFVVLGRGAQTDLGAGLECQKPAALLRIFE